MKFTDEHYQSLKNAIQTALDRDGIFISNWAVKYQDKSEQRKLWDLYWFSNWSNLNREISDKYLDSHIESALKKVWKELTKK